MHLQLPQRTLDLTEPVVMGVLNVTPDSFSDGGRYLSVDAAVQRARQMLAEGARIIDVGGESTRPGAEPVDQPQELGRVIPIIQALKREADCMVSIDTMKPAVMRAACAAGAELINDVNALRAPGALEAAQDSGAAICLMHMRGESRTMQDRPQYTDVVAEVREFLRERLHTCLRAGIAQERVVLDPGFGFGKTLEHNLTLLAQLPALTELGRPLLIGLSRKSMFGQLLGLPPAGRATASASAAALAVWQGAAIVRAHDVQATVEAIRFAAACANFRGAM